MGWFVGARPLPASDKLGEAWEQSYLHVNAD